MTRIRSVFMMVAACFALFAAQVEAARLGGGKSVGRQSQNVTNREATPPQAPQAAPGQAAQAQPGMRPNQAPAAQPQRNRWLGPIAGLAAGLGLAALASHLGFGEELASFMMIALLAVAVLVIVRRVRARRGAAARPALTPAPAYGHTGIGSEATVNYAPLRPEPVSTPASGAGAALAPVASAPVGEEPRWQIPAGFDAEGFVRNAKVQFIRLQAAFDAANLADLREFTSPELFAELKMQIEERGAARNQTDVVKLDAELLGIETGPVDYLASVRFSGMLREGEGAAAQNFDEVWNLSTPVSGSSGWVLSGIQQLG